MSNLPLGAEFDSKAPWNIEDPKICTDCNIDMDIIDSGTIGKIIWHEYKCPKCGFGYSEEPDYE